MCFAHGGGKGEFGGMADLAKVTETLCQTYRKRDYINTSNIKPSRTKLHLLRLMVTQGTCNYTALDRSHNNKSGEQKGRPRPGWGLGGFSPLCPSSLISSLTSPAARVEM